MDTCEDLAFKNINELADLNKNDLLNIIAFLQAERKLWINQFTKNHNESVDIQEENQELKKQLEEKENIACNWKDSCLENAGKIEILENQQKDFIKWLEDYLALLDTRDIYEEGSYDTIEEILQKYKEIIGE